MSKNIKGLAIGLAAIVIILAVVFFSKTTSQNGAEPAATVNVETASDMAMPEMAPEASIPPSDPNQPPMPETAVETAPEASPETALAETPVDEPPSFAPEQAPAAPAVPTEDVTVKTETASDLLAAPASMQLNIAEVMQDNVLGNPDAPVTILEYASMTCPHCAHFSMDVLPEVKERLITTGKAKLIFREFPLDQLAMKASKMARCAPRDKYFDLIEVIFRNQDRWIKAEDPEKSLMQLGTLAGMTEERMKTCINSQELEAAILSGLQEGQSKYAIKSTPTFIFNYGAETFAGGRSADEFEATVNKLSAGQ